MWAKPWCDKLLRQLLSLSRQLIAIGLWSLVGRRSARPQAQDYAAQMWKDSTSRIGLKINQRVRDAWRRRWLNISSFRP